MIMKHIESYAIEDGLSAELRESVMGADWDERAINVMHMLRKLARLHDYDSLHDEIDEMLQEWEAQAESETQPVS
jgi:hypothetical protein